MTHCILALDLGTTMGWAYSVDNHIYASGELALIKNDAGYKGLKFASFWNWLNNFRDHNQVDEVVFEDVRSHPRSIFDPKTGRRSSSQNIFAAHVYGGYLALLYVFCEFGGTPRFGIKPNVLKKEFTGKGNANKALMCAECHNRGWTGGAIGTDKANNEADARALLHVTLEKRGLDVIVDM